MREHHAEIQGALKKSMQYLRSSRHHRFVREIVSAQANSNGKPELSKSEL
jgi:hypothetical protein